MVSVHVPAGGPVSGKDPAISGDYEGTAIPFYPVPERGEGIYEAVVGVPVDHKPGPSEIKVSIGPAQTLSVPLTIVSGQYPSTALTVAPGQVNPGAKALKRIKKEIAETAPLYKRLTLKKYWNGPFVLPINSTINSPFGEHRTYNGEPRNYHPGLDLKAAIGTPIHAPAGGIVVLAKNLYFTGYTVMIDHGYGIITLYAHMSKLRVKKGQEVHAGDLLGLSGKTGRVTGPHLHWQVKIHDVKVNPLGLVQVLR